MQIKTHMGVSLDGLVTSADGLPAWDWDPGNDGKSAPPGYSDFMDNVGAVIMGRRPSSKGSRIGRTPGRGAIGRFES